LVSGCERWVKNSISPFSSYTYTYAALVLPGKLGQARDNTQRNETADVFFAGENNMFGIKGNSIADAGYGCMQRVLISGWRDAWSKTSGTTDPMAPFGIVTLAS
jgi:hypothetical protein